MSESPAKRPKLGSEQEERETAAETKEVNIEEEEHDEEEYEGEEEEEYEEEEKRYEYLDHTADVKLHSWGDNLKEAFQEVVHAMMNLISDLSYCEIEETREIEAEGHDMQSLLFNFMDEFLFVFNGEYFLVKEVTITEFDRENFKIKATGAGELFSRDKHLQGTEVKAITYSAMAIIEEEDGSAEVGVVVDI